jgi:hypothetical protein
VCTTAAATAAPQAIVMGACGCNIRLFLERCFEFHNLRLFVLNLQHHSNKDEYNVEHK